MEEQEQDAEGAAAEEEDEEDEEEEEDEELDGQVSVPASLSYSRLALNSHLFSSNRT